MKGWILILLLAIPLISAQNISISYPEQVNVGEEFSVKMELLDFTSGIYDIKIDLLGNGTRIAQILNNGQWKSTYYYITGAINSGEEKEFSLKIAIYIGKADIEIKIRDSKGNSKSFSGYEIETISSTKEETTNEKNNTADKNPVKNKDAENNKENSENNESVSDDISKPKDKTNYTDKKDVKYSETAEVIKLIPTGKDIKTNSDKENSVSRYAIYGFVTFCILLLVLFMLKIKKEKYNKNEFE